MADDFEKAILTGDLHAVMTFVNDENEYDSEYFALACEVGNMEIIRLLYDHEFPFDEEARFRATTKEVIDFLDFICCPSY